MVQLEAHKPRGRVPLSTLPVADVLSNEPLEEPPPIPGPSAAAGWLPLIDSRWDFPEQCRALIASKAYSRASTDQL
jgi:hypothetical protein